MAPIPVIFDHDGGHDDFVALAVLLANPDKVKVIGCVVTDADCFVDTGFQVSGKLMTLMHCTESVKMFPIGRCSFKGLNPFPTDWRWCATNMNDLPSLNIPEHVALWKRVERENEKHIGEQLMADLVMNSKEKVTICVTGPLNCVAWCIKTYGDRFVRNVEKCVVMGGAVDVKGNVFTKGKSGKAEWNIYWDPQAAKTVLENPPFETVLFSLDSTNQVPINSPIVQRFGATNRFLLSQFVGSAWSCCTHLELMRPGDGYYAWDVLAAAYVIQPNISATEPMMIEVITDPSHPDEGRTTRSKGTSTSLLKVATKVNSAMFYKMCYDSVRRGLHPKL